MTMNLSWPYKMISQPIRLSLDEFVESQVLQGDSLIIRRGNILFDYHLETDLEDKVHYLDAVFYTLAEEEGRYVHYDIEENRVVFSNTYHGGALDNDWKKLLIIHVPSHPLYNTILEDIVSHDSAARMDRTTMTAAEKKKGWYATTPKSSKNFHRGDNARHRRKWKNVMGLLDCESTAVPRENQWASIGFDPSAKLKKTMKFEVEEILMSIKSIDIVSVVEGADPFVNLHFEHPLLGVLRVGLDPVAVKEFLRCYNKFMSSFEHLYSIKSPEGKRR